MSCILVGCKIFVRVACFRVQRHLVSHLPLLWACQSVDFLGHIRHLFSQASFSIPSDRQNVAMPGCNIAAEAIRINQKKCNNFVAMINWRTNDEKVIPYVRSIYCFQNTQKKVLLFFSAHSTTFGNSGTFLKRGGLCVIGATHCERSGIRVVNKFWSYILFEFAKLRSWTALLTIFLCFLWFCYVQISQRDYSRTKLGCTMLH